jgi:hypothetical protein
MPAITVYNQAPSANGDKRPSSLPGRRYLVPQGFSDLPFQYVFNGDDLTASAYNNLSIQITRGDFILRRIAGVVNVAGSIQLKNRVGAYTSNAPINLPDGDWAVIPEQFYPMGSFLEFDLAAVSPARSGAQILFQGVRRLAVPNRSFPLPSSYEWWPLHYQFVRTATLGAVGAPPVKVIQFIDACDFELWSISVTPWGHGQFQATLYDPYVYALSNVPVNDEFLVFSQEDAAGGGNDLMSVFPDPPVLYPVNSEIVLELTATVTPSVPLDYRIVFNGIRRRPRR